MSGSVFSLSKKSPRFQERVISYISREVLKAIDFLHSFGRVHRDIKTENILFNQEGDVKITDFGFTAQLTAENACRTTIVGTPAYMAPEMIDRDGYDDKVDIWAVGIVAFELAEGKVPVEGCSNIETLTITSNSPSPLLSKTEEWSEEFHDFLAKCFEKRPERRISSKELLKHGFLQYSSKQSFRTMVMDYLA
jgi:serine/threonine protein kinase